MQVKKQQLEPDMKQPTGSKLGKEYPKAMYYHPAYLTYMQSTPYKMCMYRIHTKCMYPCWAGRSTSWNQDCREKHQ